MDTANCQWQIDFFSWTFGTIIFSSGSLSVKLQEEQLTVGNTSYAATLFLEADGLQTCSLFLTLSNKELIVARAKLEIENESTEMVMFLV
jgi:arginine/ornithine N-succinyltransferase beta subunit